MEVHEDLEDAKDGKERTDNKSQVPKLQVGVLVSGFVVVGIFLFRALAAAGRRDRAQTECALSPRVMNSPFIVPHGLLGSASLCTARQHQRALE